MNHNLSNVSFTAHGQNQQSSIASNGLVLSGNSHGRTVVHHIAENAQQTFNQAPFETLFFRALQTPLTSQMLQEDPRSIDVRNGNGDTPLMLVCKEKVTPESLAIALALLDRGANPEALNQNRELFHQTPLGIIASKIHPSESASAEDEASLSVANTLYIKLRDYSYRTITKARLKYYITSEADFQIHVDLLEQQFSDDYHVSLCQKFRIVYGGIYHVFSPDVQTSIPARTDQLLSDVEQLPKLLAMINWPGAVSKKRIIFVFNEVLKRAERLIRGDLNVPDWKLREARESFPSAAREVFFENLLEGNWQRVQCWLDSANYPELKLDSLTVEIDGDTFNLLHYTVWFDIDPIFKLLLQRCNLDFIEKKSANHRTISDIALQKKRPLCLVLLEMHYARLNIPVSFKEHYEIVDDENNTATHLALDKGDVEALRYILRKLPNQSRKKNRRGQTPLDLLNVSIAKYWSVEEHERANKLQACKKIFLEFLAANSNDAVPASTSEI